MSATQHASKDSMSVTRLTTTSRPISQYTSMTRDPTNPRFLAAKPDFVVTQHLSNLPGVVRDSFVAELCC